MACTTLYSLNADIEQAQRRVDSGSLGAQSSLNFRILRKEEFLSGVHDAKLIAQGCEPLGGVVEEIKREPTTTIKPPAEGGETMKIDGVQTGIPVSTPSSSGKSMSYGSVSPNYSDSSRGGGFRTILVLAAVGGVLFFLHKKGKLDGVISKGKQLVGKIKKK